MKKRADNHLVIADFEAKANEFIGLTFDYCEEQLRRVRSHHPLPKHPKSQVLPYAAVSVEQSIKDFLAILKMPNE